MRGKILNYYAEGNTAEGFYRLYDSVLEGYDRLFNLSGGSRSQKSLFLKAIGENIVRKGINVEYLHCASDNHQITGILIPKYLIGIINEEVLDSHTQKNHKVKMTHVDFVDTLDKQKLMLHNNEILKLNELIVTTKKLAYDTFAKALQAHTEVESIYINNMNFSEANNLTEEIISDIYNKEKTMKTGSVSHRFLGAATPKGAVDFIPNLTEGLKKRYLIKGRSGSGKSTILKKVTAAGKESGYDVEVYHCGFDPNSLDMVIIREKGIAIFDSTAPHEYFTERKNDEIIDIYKRCITPGTDETFATQIASKKTIYKNTMKEAITYLAEAKGYYDKLEDYYIGATDYSLLAEKQRSLLDKILKIVEE